MLIGDDSKQLAVAEVFTAQGAWISHLVLAETMWVIGSVYGRSREQILSAVEMLLAHDSFAIDAPDLVRNAVGVCRESKKVGFTDALILETARRAGHLPLGTFDKNLGKCDGAEHLKP